MEKQCFKCSETKPLTEFYKHPKMGDGHLNKCKSCTKRDVVENYSGKRELYSEYEKQRQQRPERKKAKQAYLQTHRKRYPQRNAARQAVARAIRSGALIRQPCQKCGSTENIHAHHTDYSKPLDVEWLCDKHHREAHGKQA